MSTARSRAAVSKNGVPSAAQATPRRQPIPPFSYCGGDLGLGNYSIEPWIYFIDSEGQKWLIVSKLDRLGRDAQDVGATVKLLAARKISVIVLQLGKLDLASAAGKMMLTMLAAVAEMERDLLVERTQSGLARAKSEGKVLGRPSKTTVDQRAEIAAKYEKGESVSALAREYSISRASILGVVKPA